MIPFLKEVAADLVNRFGNELHDVTIVFNNKRPATYLRKYLATLYNRPLWSPQIYTIQDFFSLSSTHVVASSLTQFFALYDIYNDLLRQSGKKTVSPDVFYPIAETILQDFSQLDYDLVDPEAVYSELYEMDTYKQQFPNFTDEQLQYLETFWSSFNANKQHAVQQKFIELWQILPILYKGFHQSLAKKKCATQAYIYRSLAEEKAHKPSFANDCKSTVFIGFNALNKAEAQIFKRWQEEGKALFYFDADRYYLEDPLQEAGLFIRKNLKEYGLKNALGNFSDDLKSKKTDLHIYPCSGFTAQAKLLHTLISEQPKETARAVFLADETLLVPVLQSIPDNLTPNITMGFPASQSSIFGLIDIWIQVQEQQLIQRGSIHYQQLENLLSHPLTAIEEQAKERIRTRLVQNEWINIPIDALELEIPSLPTFFIISDRPYKAVNLLIAVLSDLLAYRLDYKLLTHPEASIINALIKALHQLNEGINSYEAIEMRFLFSLIRKHIAGIIAPIEGEPLQGLQIMGLLESRCLDFDEIYILGANEGTLPKLSTSATFIPETIRRAHGLPTLENQDALSAYLFYRLLQRSQHIHVLYNSLVTESSSGEPSRFILQLQFESSFHIHRHIHKQKVIGSKQREPFTVQKRGLVWNRLQDYLIETDLKRPKISATAFTTYLHSPLLFFFKYIAKIEEPKMVTEEIELNKLGSIVHQSLQWFYEEIQKKNQPISAQLIGEMLPQIPALCLQALSFELYHDRKKLDQPKAIHRILLHIVQEYVQIILEYDSRYTPFSLVELENKDDYVVPFNIMVAGEKKTVLLYGIIDRVDMKNGRLRIVDYKTGADELRFSNEEDLFDVPSGKSNKALLQTLFYTYVYETLTGEKNVEPHLYAVRKLRQEGSLFYKGTGFKKERLEGDILYNLKETFKEYLRSNLEALFNPDIPFAHREGVAPYQNNPYEEFFSKKIEDEHLER